MARPGYRNRRNSRDSENMQNFGEVLRQTREKHGISLAEVSADLKVRTDILIAIEQGDFSKIPPQGYSRNMIKSYARLLGLNANKITDMFLDAEYSYRLSKKQASAKEIAEENKKRVPSTVAPRRKAKTTMTPREQLEQRKLNSQEKIAEDNNSSGSFLKQRTLHVYGNRYKNTPRARREQDSETDMHRGRRSFEENAAYSNDLLDGGSYSSARERLERRRTSQLQSDQTQEVQNVQEKPKSKSGYQFMNVYHKKNNSNQSSMQIPIIAGAVIVLIVVLILVFFFVGKQNENSKTDVSNLNVVGISDVEKSDSSSDEGDNNNNAAEPKEVEFKYKVKDGESVYMEIYENDSNKPILAREVKSGETNTFKVTGKLKVVTSRPSGVEFYVANQLVEPQDTSGNGVYTYTCDFNEYLTKWKQTNATKKKP